MSELDQLLIRFAALVAERIRAQSGLEFITGLNCESELGVPFRRLRDWSKQTGFPQPVRVGKTLMFPRRELVEHLRAQERHDEPQHDAADEVLAEIIGPGMVRAV